jgi:NADH-quinone oxidoreductase subunit D
VTKVSIPIGPQHPLLKEPLSFVLTVEGEQVLDSSLRLGYVHRGIERLAQERTYVQTLHLIERICGICSHVHTTTYCQAVEALLGLEVPARGLYIRALLCELERIHSHLLWMGVLGKNIGLDTVFMYAWRDREMVLEVMEELSGGRVSHAVNLIGGVRVDLVEDHARTIRERLDDLADQVERLLGFIRQEPTFKARTAGVGHLSKEQVQEYCVVGPVARASGVDVDLRRDAALPPYGRLDFDVITHTEGDVWARTMVRVRETQESLKLCHQILSELPSGPVAVRAGRRVPTGEVVSRSEAPRGEVVYYLRSDGSDKPARLKIRTPTLTTLPTLAEQLRGVSMADVPVVLAGVDLCIACADR